MQYPQRLAIVGSDNGGDLLADDVGEVCKQFCIKPSSTAYRESAMYHPERGISACIQVPIRCPRVQLPPTKLLWVEAVDSANDALNHTATPANPGNKSPHGMWYGTAAHASPHPFLDAGYNALRIRCLGPRAVANSGLASNAQVMLRVLTWANKVFALRVVA